MSLILRASHSFSFVLAWTLKCFFEVLMWLALILHCRAPLFTDQSEDWDCSCAIQWDPIRADCVVPQVNSLYTNQHGIMLSVSRLNSSLNNLMRYWWTHYLYHIQWILVFFSFIIDTYESQYYFPQSHWYDIKFAKLPKSLFIR